MATTPKVSNVDLAEGISEDNGAKNGLPEISDERREEIMQEIKKVQ